MIIQPAKRTESLKEYYFSIKNREIAKLNDERLAKGEDSVINLGIGSPDGTPPRAALSAVAETVIMDGVHGYQSYMGIPEFRQALADWYAAPEQYAACWDSLLGGGDERAQVDPAGAEALVRRLLGDGYEAAMADPRIDAYLRQVYELFGRTSTGEKSGVPRLIAGQRWLVPEVDTADALLELIRSELL